MSEIATGLFEYTLDNKSKARIGRMFESVVVGIVTAFIFKTYIVGVIEDIKS